MDDATDARLSGQVIAGSIEPPADSFRCSRGRGPASVAAAPAQHQPNTSKTPTGSWTLAAYDNVFSAISQFNDQAPDSPDDLGSEVAAQWEKWHSTFDQELSALKEAIGAMINKILAAGTTYEAAERINQANARSVKAEL